MPYYPEPRIWRSHSGMVKIAEWSDGTYACRSEDPEGTLGVVLSFHLPNKSMYVVSFTTEEGGRANYWTLPGAVVYEDKHTAANEGLNRKLMWLLFELGLTDAVPPDTKKPILRQPSKLKLHFPLFLTDDYFPRPVPFPLAPEDLDDISAVKSYLLQVFRTESDLNLMYYVNHGRGEPRGYIEVKHRIVSFPYYLLPSRRGDSVWWTISPEGWDHEERFATEDLREGLLKFIELFYGHFPASMKEAWLETRLEAGEIGCNTELYELIEEPPPIVWKWENFLSWANESGLEVIP